MSSERIYLDTYRSDRQRPDWHTELTKGGLPLLQSCRSELEKAGHSCILNDAGAKIFVRPDQWTKVMGARINSRPLMGRELREGIEGEN